MSAKRVIMHVGPPKTGTTAIQSTMDENRADLANMGIGYWSAGRAHAKLLKSIVGGNVTKRRRRAQLEVSVDDLRSSLLAELDACDTFVLSGENMSTFEPWLMKPLIELLSSRGAEITGVFYVREPRAKLTSGVQQRLKSGTTIAQSLGEIGPSLARCERMLRSFGSERLSVRAYRGLALVPDFLEFVGVDAETAKTLTPAVRNESLPHEVAMIMDGVLTLAERSGQPLIHANRLAKLLSEEMPGPKFQLPTAAHDAFLVKHATALDRLSELLGEDVRGLPTSVAPPPEVPRADPQLVAVLYELARRDGKIGAAPAGAGRLSSDALAAA